MQEAKKNVILRVFRTAHCPPGKYFFGVTCSALSVLLSGVPFYTVYRIIRLFLLASLDGAAAPTHEIWMWAAVTIGSIVLGIVLSVIGSFSCHACAFNALYDLRMRLLDHMGRLNLGFYTGGQSGATQKMMNENIEKMENIIAHDVSNIFGAGLLLAALAVLMFSLNIPLALTIFIALVLAFLIQFSAFGGKQGQKIWSDLNRSSTELDAAFSEYVAGMEEEKIFGRPEAAARRLTGLVEKNREHWKVYLKRVTPIFGAYKTITISVLAFLLVSGCALLYLHPGDHELIRLCFLAGQQVFPVDVVVHHQNVRVLVTVIAHDDRTGIQSHHLGAIIAPVAGDDLIPTLAAGTDDQRLGNAGALDTVHQPHQIGAGPIYGVRLPRIGEHLLRRHDLYPLLMVGLPLCVCFEQVIVPGQLYAV